MQNPSGCVVSCGSVRLRVPVAGYQRDFGASGLFASLVCHLCAWWWQHEGRGYEHDTNGRQKPVVIIVGRRDFWLVRSVIAFS